MVARCGEDVLALAKIKKLYDLFGPLPPDFIDSPDEWEFWLEESIPLYTSQFVWMLGADEKAKLYEELHALVQQEPHLYDLDRLRLYLMLLAGFDCDGPLPDFEDYEDPVTARVIGGPLDGHVLYAERRHIESLRPQWLPQVAKVGEDSYEIRYSHCDFN